MNLSKKALQTKGSSTLTITAKAKQLISEGKNIIAFTAGEPDFNTPDNIKASAINAINSNQTTYTPANGIEPLKEAICNKLKVDNNLNYTTDEIVVSSGAKHSLANTFIALLDKDDEVLIPIPYWLSYKSMVELADGVPVFVKTKKENDYKPTIEDLEKYISSKTKVLLLNSPSNPTGSVLSLKELELYAEFAKKHDLIVVSDEIYEYLIYNDDVKHISIASLDAMKERTIVVNGVSKSYAMTGWRIGYIAGPKDFAKAVTNIQSHMTSNPCTIAQHASVTALNESSDAIKVMTKSFKERRDYIYDNICAIDGISCVYPQGAFYLYIDVTELIGKSFNNQLINNCTDVSNILLNDFDVCVIPCVDFGSTTHIRLSYAIPLSNIIEGVKRIENFVNLLK